MKRKTTTEQLRNVGYTPKQIKTIHNHHFRVYNKFKDFNIVEIHNNDLWFINEETGEILGTDANFYKQF